MSSPNATAASPTPPPSPSIAYHTGNITKADLTAMTASYQTDLDPNETTSCLIKMADILKLISQYTDPDFLQGQKPIDGFRIYFYRPEPIEIQGHPQKSISRVGNKGQLSIIIVPTNNYNHATVPISVSADNMFINGQCRVLTPGGETTGLCPKNCGGS